MGLITGLLTLPIAPVRGVAWITEKVAEQAELELYDEGRVLREMAQLDESYAAGVVSEERYEAEVDELLARLEYGRSRAHG